MLSNRGTRGVEVCATVANGIEAIEAAIALRPDVLILDVLMPELNGIQVASALKKSLPSAKIILFTVLSDAISSQLITGLGVSLVSKVDGLAGLGVLRALGRAVQDLLDAQGSRGGRRSCPCNTRGGDRRR